MCGDALTACYGLRVWVAEAKKSVPLCNYSRSTSKMRSITACSCDFVLKSLCEETLGLQRIKSNVPDGS